MQRQKQHTWDQWSFRNYVHYYIMEKHFDPNKCSCAETKHKHAKRIVSSLVRKRLGDPKLLTWIYLSDLPDVLQKDNRKVRRALASDTAKCTIVTHLIDNFLKWWVSFLRSLVQHNMQLSLPRSLTRTRGFAPQGYKPVRLCIKHIHLYQQQYQQQHSTSCSESDYLAQVFYFHNLIWQQSQPNIGAAAITVESCC